MKIVFMGTPEFARVSLKKLLGSSHQVIGVLTQPDRPKGRGLKVIPSPVKELATLYGLPVFQPRGLPNPEVRSFLEGERPDVIAVVAYGLKIPSEVLGFSPHGCVNLHASLLPKYRGASPIQWAIINGEQNTGLTTMKMDEGWDTGDMLLTRSVPIKKDDNFERLHDRLAETGANLLVETFDQLETGMITPIPQNHDEATYARKLKAEDLVIDWSRASLDLYNLIRALDPWPGARTNIDGQTIKIWSSRMSMEWYGLETAAPGTIGEAGIARGGEDGIPVRTGDGVLLLSELQFPGKRRLTARQFLAGNSITPGTRFMFNTA